MSATYYKQVGKLHFKKSNLLKMQNTEIVLIKLQNTFRYHVNSFKCMHLRNHQMISAAEIYDKKLCYEIINFNENKFFQRKIFSLSWI